MRTPDEFIRISRYLDGECSPEEEIIVRAWLEQDPDAARWAEDVRAAEFMVGETLGVLWSMPPIEAVLNAADAAALEEAKAAASAARQAGAARAGSSERGASARQRAAGSDSSARLAKVSAKSGKLPSAPSTASGAVTTAPAVAAEGHADGAGGGPRVVGRVIALAARYRQAMVGMAAGIMLMALLSQPAPTPDDAGVVYVTTSANGAAAGNTPSPPNTDGAATENATNGAPTNNATNTNDADNPLNHVDIGDPEDMGNHADANDARDSGDTVDHGSGGNDNGNGNGNGAAVDNSAADNGTNPNPNDTDTPPDNPDSHDTTPRLGPADWVPVAVSVEPLDEGILLSWDAPLNTGEAPVAYVIYRLSPDAFDRQFEEVGRIGPDERTFLDDNVSDRGVYQYRVASVYLDEGEFCESDAAQTGDLEYGTPVQVRFVGLQALSNLVLFRVNVWDGDWVSRHFRARPGEAFDCQIGGVALRVKLLEVYELDPEDLQHSAAPSMSMYVRCEVTRDGETETVEIPFYRG